MLRCVPLLIIIVLAASACAPVVPSGESDPFQWHAYRDSELGVMFEYPSSFTIIQKNETEIQVGTGTPVVAQSVTFFPAAAGETPAIRFYQTDDKRILELFSYDHPLEKRRMQDKEVMYYRQDGMGEPFGYIFELQGNISVLSFTFMSDQQVAEHVLRSIQIDGKKVLQ